MQLQDQALREIDNRLAQHGKSLADFPPMRIPAQTIEIPRIIREELAYSIPAQALIMNTNQPQLNAGQLHVFDSICAAMEQPDVPVSISSHWQMLHCSQWD